MELRQEVQKIIDNNIDESYYDSYDEAVGAFMTDLVEQGCISGMVSGLIYYSETIPFYHRHKLEINELLKEMIFDTGFGVEKLLVGWDDDDPLALDDQNQNLLAWFGFEETAQQIAIENGIDF